MNSIQKAGFALVASTLSVTQAFAALPIDQNRVNSNLRGSENSAEVTIQNLISNFMIFLGLIAVVYALYGGFKILTAGGDDAGVKAGKTILIQAGIGLVVIFLANSLVKFILTALFPGA